MAMPPSSLKFRIGDLVRHKRFESFGYALIVDISNSSVKQRDFITLLWASQGPPHCCLSDDLEKAY